MKDLETRKRHWTDFLDKKRRTVVLIQYDDGFRPWPYPGNRRERIDYALRLFEAQMERTRWLDDDRVPYLFPYSGTEIFAQAFGCKTHLSGDNMPFALPMVMNAAGLSKVKPVRLMDSTLTELFEIADRLRRDMPGAVMARPDIQSPLDIASLIWEKSDLMAAMLEEPEAVLELIHMAEALVIEFIDAWTERYGKELIAHYPDYYMPEGFTCSEDEVGTISPRLFETLSLPSLNRLAARYKRMGVHCCANSRHQWDSFKKIQNLQLLNLVQPPEVLDEAYSFFKNECGQMHAISFVRGEPGSYSAHCGAPPDAFAVLHAPAANKEEATAKCELLNGLAADYFHAL